MHLSSKTEQIKTCFNKAANTYDQNCFLQKHTGNTLITMLKQYHFDKPDIIDLGCGTGIVTEQLMSQFDYNELYAVDIADQLLEKMKKKFLNYRINIYHADFNCLPINRNFDIIFSNLSLHWSYDFQLTLKLLIKKLKKNGVIAFSIPRNGTLEELTTYCHINHFIEPHFIQEWLHNNHCNNIIYHDEKLSFTFNTLLAALKSIKQVGANHIIRRNNMLLNNLRLQLQQKISLTYHVGYFIASK